MYTQDIHMYTTRHHYVSDKVMQKDKPLLTCLPHTHVYTTHMHTIISTHSQELQSI